jgi:hypothetical protein
VRGSRPRIQDCLANAVYLLTSVPCLVGIVIPFKPLPRRRELKRRRAPRPFPKRPRSGRGMPASPSAPWTAGPIHVRASDGVVHACESFELNPGIFITTTICKRDVDAGSEYISDNLYEVTCPVCAERRWIPLYKIVSPDYSGPERVLDKERDDKSLEDWQALKIKPPLE